MSNKLKPFPHDKISNEILECLKKERYDNFDFDELENIAYDNKFDLWHRFIIVYLWEKGVEIPEILLTNIMPTRLRTLVRAMITVMYSDRRNRLTVDTEDMPKSLIDFIFNDSENNPNFYMPDRSDYDYDYENASSSFDESTSFDLCNYLIKKGYYPKELFEKLTNQEHPDAWILYCKLVVAGFDVQFHQLSVYVEAELADLKNITYEFIVKYKLPFDKYPKDFLQAIKKSDYAGINFIKQLKKVGYKEEDIPKDFFDKVGINWDLSTTEFNYDKYEDSEFNN